MCTNIRSSPWFQFLGLILRSEPAGSYCNSIFNLFRNYHVVTHGGSTILYLYQQGTKIPIFLQTDLSCFHFVFVLVFDKSHPNGYEVDLTLVLLCFSLMINDLKIFSYACCHLKIFFGEIFPQVFCPFKHDILNVNESIHILSKKCFRI